MWACLICGCLGCGRYQQGHAAKHFELTSHSFAVDVESGRIWNYIDDGYVHRILKAENSPLIELDVEEGLTTPGNPAESSVTIVDIR